MPEQECRRRSCSLRVLRERVLNQENVKDLYEGCWVSYKSLSIALWMERIKASEQDLSKFHVILPTPRMPPPHYVDNLLIRIAPIN